ncbi:MAG TPA: hypothetical protein VKY22_31260 [Bradyrhizobium sp.]|nr:hypothetical protein [Bradyrhizobium sp.]
MTNSTQPTAIAAAVQLPSLPTGIGGFFDDLDALKLSPEEAGYSATEVLMRVPVRKPLKHEYFRVKQGQDNCFTTVLYEDKETREYYFVAPAVIPHLRAVTDLSIATLVQFATKQKVFGIFPLKIATDATAPTGWHNTAMAAAELAKTKWVRMQADMALGAYRVFQAEGQLSEPEWPDMSLNEMLDIAFKDRVIASDDHPVFNKLRGRI